MKTIRKCWYFSVRDMKLTNCPFDASYKYVGCFSVPVAEQYAKEHSYSLTYN